MRDYQQATNRVVNITYCVIIWCNNLIRDIFMNNIKHYRDLAGITQSDLASLIGKSGQSSIANYERGIREPDISTLKAIRDAFVSKGISCTLDDLVTANQAA